jgi:hypothetical protein
VRPATELAATLAGFIAGEGCFTSLASRRFAFRVAVGHVDRDAIEVLHGFLGVGSVVTFPRRRPDYQDEVVYSATALCDLVGVVVPFIDEHLRPCRKRTQYLAWRAALLDHWQHRAKRVRPCTIDGCDRPRRAKGLCRRHYYIEHGH